MLPRPWGVIDYLGCSEPMRKMGCHASFVHEPYRVHHPEIDARMLGRGELEKAKLKKKIYDGENR